MKIDFPIYSRKSGVIALLTSSYASIFLAIIKGIVLVPLYLHYIDNRLYGAWLATGSIVAYLGLLDFGFNGVIMQKAASAFGKKDFEYLGPVIGTGLIVSIIFAFIPMLIGLAISPFISDIVRISGKESGQLRYAFLTASIGSSFMLVMYAIGGILNSFQRQIVWGTLLVLGDIIGVIVTVVLLLKGYGLIAIAAGTVIWAMLSALGSGIYLVWFLKVKLIGMSVIFKKYILKDLLTPSIWQFGSRAASLVSRQSDNLLIALLVDPRICTIYTFTGKASETLSIFIRHFIGAFMPGLSHLNGEGNMEMFKNITLQMIRIVTFGGVFILGGYLFYNKSFIVLWVGGYYYGGIILTLLFLISSFLLILNTLFYNILFAKGEIVLISKANMLESIVRIPLCIGLIVVFGIKGAVIAAIVSIIPTSFLMQSRKFIEYLKLSKKDTHGLIKIFLSDVIVVFFTGVLVSNIVKPYGLKNTIFSGLLYIVGVLIMWILFNKNNSKLILLNIKTMFNSNETTFND